MTTFEGQSERSRRLFVLNNSTPAITAPKAEIKNADPLFNCVQTIPVHRLASNANKLLMPVKKPNAVPRSLSTMVEEIIAFITPSLQAAYNE